MEKFSASGSKTPTILLKNPDQVKRGKGRRFRKTGRNMRGWGRCKKRRRSGQKKGRMFVREGGSKKLHWQRVG